MRLMHISRRAGLFRRCALYSCLLVVWLPRAVSCCDDAESCKGQVSSTSLLQLNTPVRRRSEATASEGSEVEGELPNNLFLEGQDQLDSLPWSPPGAGPGQFPQPGRQAFGQRGGQSQVLALMQSASDNAKFAQMKVAADASRAKQAAEAVEDAQKSSQDARAAQEEEAKQLKLVGAALTGAFQRVQRAEEVENQELTLEAIAARRLQDATSSAKQVQALEDEGAARETRTAELLQDAVRKLSDNPSLDFEDANRPASVVSQQQLQESLQVAAEAEKASAAEASNKLHASQLLEKSLEDVATAVDALKRSKESQTSKWLRDALSNLQWMGASWGQRTAAEEKVTKDLENAVKSSGVALKLAAESNEGKQATAAVMQNAAQAARFAQQSASQEARQAQKLGAAMAQAQNLEAANAAQYSPYVQAMPAQPFRAAPQEMMQMGAQMAPQMAPQMMPQMAPRRNYMQGVMTSPMQPSAGNAYVESMMGMPPMR